MSRLNMRSTSDGHASDVVICGGGLAGLTLALQLKRELPHLDVTVAEKGAGPLSAAPAKVGESISEVGTRYLAEHLGLGPYLERVHLRKLGLRFFLGDGREPLARRPEIGLRIFPPVNAFQVDRGFLENHLRSLAREAGARVLEDCDVRDIHLSEDDGPHRVAIRDGDGSERHLSCRWAVDAMGRRRLLQRKLGLLQPSGHRASAAWFRMRGRISIEDLVPEAEQAWHRRTSEPRWFSTNHLMGHGYWIWIIPLGSDNTSFGIVTDEEVHPWRSYGASYASAYRWLTEHEPHLAKCLAEREPLDFHGAEDFSYRSRQVFSERRWSCVGEAGVFLDPFYSPGVDYIAISNTITLKLIGLDCRGELTPELSTLYNDLFLKSLYGTAIETFRAAYRTFGSFHVFAAKHLWDMAVAWAGGPVQLFVQRVLERPELLPDYMKLAEKVQGLHVQVQKLLRQWAARAPSRPGGGFLDLGSLPFLQLGALDLLTTKSTERFFADLRANVDRLEEAAQVLFFRALEETMPEHLASFPTRWVNAWAVGLERERWAADGLFEPPTAPRDLRPMERALCAGLFSRPPAADRLRRALERAIMLGFRGRPYYLLIGFATRFLIRGRGGVVRRLFVRDQPSR